LLFVLVASASAQQAAPAAAVPVGTVAAARKPIAKTADFVGRIQAVESVDVNARVTGYLEEVLFKEGDSVKEGQPLYHIEKDLFKAAVDQTNGALEASKAKKLLTAIQFERAEQLMKTNAGTVVARDQALTADRAADAQILIDQANLDTAKINLGYTDIVSPIVGKIGRTNITKGNVVSPQTGTLTKIVSQDPMYVLFPVSQRQIMKARENSPDVKGIKVRLKFPDGSTYDKVGQIDFVDVTVDKATDTVQVRAAVPNPAGTLIDGQWRRSVTNVGLRPTFGEATEPSIETYVMNWDGDLYGDVIRVRFLYRLRDERKFGSIDELKRQIETDVTRADSYFERAGTKHMLEGI